MTKEFDIHWLPGEQIILECIHPDFSIKDDTIPGNQATVAILDTAADCVPYVLDLTELRITFSDLVGALAEMTRGEAPATRHPNLRELIIVTQNPILKLGAKALTQDQYGKVPTHVFPTREEALAYARSIAP